MTVPPPNYPPPSSSQPPPPPGEGDGSAFIPPKPPRRGRLVGAFLGIVYVLVLIGIGLQLRNGIAVIIGGILLAIVGATVALASEQVRSYAAGFLIAVALVTIVVGGACVGLIAILAQGQ
jgi:hypothetical protein